MTISIIWLVTACAFLIKALLSFRNTATPSGLSRRCLLLAATSAACCGFDGLVALVFDDPTNPDGEGYGYGTGNTIGSIFLMFSLCLFAHLWADVAEALAGIQGTKDGMGSPAMSFRALRRGYDIIAVVNVPFAVAKAVAIYEGGDYFDRTNTAYLLWCLFSACLGLSGLSLLMWFIMAKYLEQTPRTRNLRRVTCINVGEQGLYDICLLITGLLYMLPQYNQYGTVQGATYTLMFVLLWLMHAQVLLFFVVCDPEDPLYSQKDFDALLAEAESSLIVQHGGGGGKEGAPEGKAANVWMAGMGPPAAMVGAAQPTV